MATGTCPANVGSPRGSLVPSVLPNGPIIWPAANWSALARVVPYLRPHQEVTNPLHNRFCDSFGAHSVVPFSADSSTGNRAKLVGSLRGLPPIHHRTLLESVRNLKLPQRRLSRSFARSVTEWDRLTQRCLCWRLAVQPLKDILSISTLNAKVVETLLLQKLKSDIDLLQRYRG